MTLDRFTLAIFLAGLLAGVGITIAVRSGIDGVRLFRYQLRQRRRPPGEPRPFQGH